MKKKINIDNLIVINKPKHLSSAQVCNKIKKIGNFKSVGHGGTLDPLASGVLVIGINKATKLLTPSINDNKSYIATIHFRYNTTTGDSEGNILNFTNHIPSLEDLINALEYLKNNEYNQKPPIFSAIKYNGKPMYYYALNNINIEIKPRLVRLYNFKIIDYKNNELIISLDVSKGFYIRSLVNDLAQILNTYGTLVGLVRTKSGNYDIKDAITLEEFYDNWN